jgi:hypothetical protein
MQQFSVYYSDVYLYLNMFRAFSRSSSGAQWLQWQPLVLPSYRGDSRVEFVVGPAIAVIELQMMGGEKPETCWAVNKRQNNKLKKLLHQVGDLFELNGKLRCQKVNICFDIIQKNYQL